MNKTTGVSPTFIGPIYVHTEKTFEAYHHFFSTIVKLKPKLMAIRAVGTDGEQVLVNAVRELEAILTDLTNFRPLGRESSLHCLIRSKHGSALPEDWLLQPMICRAL